MDFTERIEKHIEELNNEESDKENLADHCLDEEAVRDCQIGNKELFKDCDYCPVLTECLRISYYDEKIISNRLKIIKEYPGIAI